MATFGECQLSKSPIKILAKIFSLYSNAYFCPPDNSERLSFHTSPNATLTSSPSKTDCPCGGDSLAEVPGSNVENMLPKSFKKKKHVLQIIP